MSDKDREYEEIMKLFEQKYPEPVFGGLPRISKDAAAKNRNGTTEPTDGK